MFRFADPLFFLLLIPLGVAVWMVYAGRRFSGIRFAPTHRIPRRAKSWRVAASLLLPVLYLAGLSLCIVALARPQTVFSRSRHTTDAVAIQMVVDVSGSMEALDMSTKTPTGVKYRTRLDAVKETFAEFVERRPDDLIGLIVFGGYASTLSPLTSDHDALRHVLKGVETPKPQHGRSGEILNQEELLTAIGDALATACARLRDAQPVSRVIVLLSDGESNTGIIEPDQALEALTSLGVRVYTIGVGSTGRAPFWGTDIFGRKTVVYNNSRLDEKLLGRIAKETGGEYFNVKDPKGLGKAMKKIDKLEKTKVERDVYEQFNELLSFFLLPGLALISLGTALNMMAARRLI